MRLSRCPPPTEVSTTLTRVHAMVAGINVRLRWSPTLRPLLPSPLSTAIYRRVPLPGRSSRRFALPASQVWPPSMVRQSSFDDEQSISGLLGETMTTCW